MKIKSITVVDEQGKEFTYTPQDTMLLALCENKDNKDEPFVLSQLSSNQSMQLTMLKAILKSE